ncbi:hypothetical protein CFP66_08665 [Pseudonocardia sp. MH-G8]|nr:hypothetical protein CFP66_08665 [Pseudonocardia sp. MH-G8]
MSRRLLGVLGATAWLALASCSADGAATPDLVGESPSVAPRPADGFDECSLVTPREVAERLGVDAMYVTSRSAMALTDGSLSASCRYFPEDIPGMMGMQLSTVADTDAERFFAPFETFDNVGSLDNLGDRTEVVAYGAVDTPNHFIEIRTLDGDRGLHLFYAYRDGGSGMPEIEGPAAATLLTTAMKRLPDEVTITNGAPQGRCAGIDLDHATEAVGRQLVMARSVESGGDALNCHFGGDGASLDISLVTDPAAAKGRAVAPDQVTHSDLGDGARIVIAEGGALSARINLGDHVLVIDASYGEDSDTVTEPRPAHVELVRAIVDGIGTP